MVIDLSKCDGCGKCMESCSKMHFIPPDRQYIKVLRLLEGASLRELARAVEAALELGAADADAVRLILEHRRERPVGLFCLDGRPHLKLVSVPSPDLGAYRDLTTEVRP